MQVLTDPDLDEQLRTEGFVVVDLLTGDQVAELLAAWSTLELTDPPVWDPTGLAATVRHPGLDHRADAHIRSVVGPVLDDLMIDRVPFMSSYLVKRPHAGALPAHIDWRLVDEPRTLTHGCWVPLSPAGETTGAFGVVPGSHRRVDFDRTPEEPGHEWTCAFVEDGAPTHLLHVEPGRAVVYDHRLVHFSTANDADDERIAVNSGISSLADEAGARTRLLEMMLRGMHPTGGSQIDPAASDAGPEAGAAATSGAEVEPAAAPAPEDPAATASVGRSGGWRRLFGRR